MFSLILPLITCLPLALSATITYNWNVTWVSAAPDGFTRPVIGINNQWPCPTLEATVGDTVIVNLYNDLGNETTGLHFHGLFMKNTPQMDGPVGVTQCSVMPGTLFKYEFKVTQPGTFWYHSHAMGQYPDGLRGPLIIYDPADPYADDYDEEIVLTTSDWYHEQVPPLLQRLLSPSNPRGASPIPNAHLLNDQIAPVNLNVQPGKTYKVRLISLSALAGTMFQFDSHTMRIIEIDGVYTVKKDVDQIRIAPAQRYAFLINAKKDKGKRNYGFTASLDINRDFAALPDPVFPLNRTGNLVYCQEKRLPRPYVVDKWNPASDFTMTPLDAMPLLPDPEVNIQLDVTEAPDRKGIPRMYMNGITYVPQKVPTLYSALTTNSSATNPKVYGVINPKVVSYGQVVQIVVNNLGFGLHPFHLHGHTFQILDEAASGAGPYSGETASFPAIPARRDTVDVNSNSHLVIRFVADNPGVWLFHCHIEWHVDMGLTATIIESPEILQRTVTIPQNHLDACKAAGSPVSGNAAGNTVDFLDLRGANTEMPDPYYGALIVPPVGTAPSGKRSVRRRIGARGEKKWEM